MSGLIPGFSFHRFWAILLKEFIQMRRDRLTFAMMVGIPIIQLVLFGYAINTNPHSLPTVIVDADQSRFSRAISAALQNTDYFKITATVESEADADKMIEMGSAQFVLRIPENFSRKLQRGEHPSILVDADATDPAASGNALAAVSLLAQTALRQDLKGPLSHLNATPAPFTFDIHRRYNPEIITQFNVVPGLIGVVLTLTMVLMTALALTREHERGTMETLLSMPVRPLEVMLGKILPYVFVGYVQVAVLLIASAILFQVPLEGSLSLLMGVLVLFIAANLTVGFTFSSMARTQGQAMQMTIFFFMPSLLLSGFMFPFHGMPIWAQYLGETLPLTHFLRIVRGIMLKGNGITEITPDVGALIAWIVVMGTIAMMRYRQTLD